MRKQKQRVLLFCTMFTLVTIIHPFGTVFASSDNAPKAKFQALSPDNNKEGFQFDLTDSVTNVDGPAIAEPVWEAVELENQEPVTEPAQYELEPENTEMFADALITSQAVINVKNAPYYATGDGVTSDVAAVTDALNYAQTNGAIVYFPEGTYNLNGLYYVATKPLYIHGDGAEYSQIIGNSYLYGRLFTCVDDVTVSDIAFIDNMGAYIFLLSPNVLPSGVSDPDFDPELDPLKKLHLTNVALSGSGSTARDLLVAFRCIDGDNVNGYDDIFVSGCDIQDMQSGFSLRCAIKAATGKQRIFQYNTFSDLGSSTATMAFGILLGYQDSYNVITAPANNIIIRYNHFEDFVTVPSIVQEATYSRGILVYGNNLLINGNTLENIKGGLGHEGIYVKGDYNTYITNNQLTNAGDEGCITVKADIDDHTGLLIKGNTIIKTGSHVIPGAAIVIIVPGATIEDNTVQINTGSGVYSYGHTNDIVIRNNDFQCSNSHAIDMANPVVWDNRDPSWEIYNNTINQTTTISAPAIYLRALWTGVYIDLHGNTVYASGSSALHFAYSVPTAYAHIYNNYFEIDGFAWGGLIDMGNITCDVEYNEIVIEQENANYSVPAIATFAVDTDQRINNNTFVIEAPIAYVISFNLIWAQPNPLLPPLQPGTILAATGITKVDENIFIFPGDSAGEPGNDLDIGSIFRYYSEANIDASGRNLDLSLNEVETRPWSMFSMNSILLIQESYLAIDLGKIYIYDNIMYYGAAIKNAMITSIRPNSAIRPVELYVTVNAMYFINALDDGRPDIDYIINPANVGTNYVYHHGNGFNFVGW